MSKSEPNCPGGTLKFKSFNGVVNMDNTKDLEERFEEDRFKAISDFKMCMNRGGEVEFEWNNRYYSITHPDGLIYIGEEYKEETAKEYKTVDEALEHVIDGQKLREIITQVKVWDRTI